MIFPPRKMHRKLFFISNFKKIVHKLREHCYQYLVASPLTSKTLWILLGMESLRVFRYSLLKPVVHSTLISLISLGKDQMSFPLSLSFMKFKQFSMGFRSGLWSCGHEGPPLSIRLQLKYKQ
jgi:hypothetical protein